MKISTIFAATATASFLALVATDLSASAQDLTNGPNGMQPNKLSSKTMAGKQPSRMIMKPGSKMHRKMTMHRKTSFRYGHWPMHYADTRPLVVRPATPVMAATPLVPGPGELISGPLALGSNLAALPFRSLGAIFPATGDVATNPLVIVGAPLHAAGDLAQVPFRLIGGATAATY